MRRLAALDKNSLNGKVLEGRWVEDTREISEYAQFNWYDWVEYYDPAEAA